MKRNSQRSKSEVDDYIAKAPAEARKKLEEVRKAIRSVVPDAVERVSYGMPGYSYPGYSFKGMVAWFALRSDYVGLYVRPPTIEEHQADLRDLKTTKSAVHLPIAQKTPVKLVQKLVRASRRHMKEGERRIT